MRKALAIAFLPLSLAACGGGSSTSSDQPPPGQAGDTTVAAASTAVATQIGASDVPGTTATTQAYDLTADIGDTWRVLLNQDGTYTIKVLSTQYSLADASGTYTQSTKDNFVVFTGAGASTFVLTLDKRTRTIVGKVTLGGKASAVAGSGYVVPADTSKLAGDYVFFGSARNAIGGGSPDVVGGSFRVAANGTDITLCDGGLVNANGGCDAISGTSGANKVALTLQKNSGDGLTHVKMGSDDFGILNLQAGDRGPVLVIDRFGYNEENVLRTGAFYAVKQQALAGNEADGTWECIDRGTVIGTVVAKGTTMKATDASGQTSNETFYYNKVLTTSANGFITTVASGDQLTDGVVIMPLSSSLAVVERDQARTTAVCHLKN